MKPSRTLEDLKIARDLINKKTITHNLVRYTLPYEMWLRVKRTYPDLLPFTTEAPALAPKVVVPVQVNPNEPPAGVGVVDPNYKPK